MNIKRLFEIWYKIGEDGAKYNDNDTTESRMQRAMNDLELYVS